MPEAQAGHCLHILQRPDVSNHAIRMDTSWYRDSAPKSISSMPCTGAGGGTAVPCGNATSLGQAYLILLSPCHCAEKKLTFVAMYDDVERLTSEVMSNK